MSELANQAQALRELHRPGEPLVLANAWDAATTKAIEAAGFPAVATTSSGIAHSLGYEDGQRTPPDEMFAAVRRIGAAIDLTRQCPAGPRYPRALSPRRAGGGPDQRRRRAGTRLDPLARAAP